MMPAWILTAPVQDIDVDACKAMKKKRGSALPNVSIRCYQCHYANYLSPSPPMSEYSNPSRTKK